MKKVGESLLQAPELFDNYTKPSEWAEDFRIYASKLMNLGIAHLEDDTVAPTPGTGLEIEFSKDMRWVRTVSLRSSLSPKSVIFKIEFSPPDQHMTKGIVDNSIATFRTMRDAEGGTHKENPDDTFTRKLLVPGDKQVNEFFRDMAAAIAPAQS